MSFFQYGNMVERTTVVATAAGTTTLVNTSTVVQIFTGSTTQTIVLPNATTFATTGNSYKIYNQSSAALTLQFNGGAAFTDASGISYSSIAPHSSLAIELQTNATSAGTWAVLASGTGGISNWVASLAYVAGNLVIYSKMIWIATGSFTSGASFEADVVAGNWQMLNTPQIANNYAVIGNNFEDNDTSGWQAFTNTLTSLIPTGTPTIGTGASISLSAVSSGALSQTYSLQNTTATTWTAGQGLISPAYQMDLAGQAKSLNISFNYSATAGATNMNFSGTSSNTYACYIYDVTNSVWIQPAGVYNFVQNSGVGNFTGSFQTSSNMTSFRIALFVINANTSGTTTMLFDSFYVGKVAAVTGPAMSDWKTFTPTGTWTTNTTYAGQYRRIGDSAEINYTLSFSGLPATGTLTLNMPSGMVIDQNKINTSSNVATIGEAAMNTGGQNWMLDPLLNSTTTILITYSTNVNIAVAGLTPTAPTTIASGGVLICTIRVPIVGWSSNTVMSADTDTRVVATTAYLAAGSITPAANGILIFDTIIKDTTGSYSTSTGKYTAPVSGFYNVEVQTTAGAVTNINLYYNNSIFSNLCSPNGVHATGAQTLYMNAGDTISINSSTSTALFGGTAPYQTYLSVYRLSGPATIAATESVNARYAKSATMTIPITTPATIVFDTKYFDSHSAYNSSTGVYKAPVSGTYSIYASYSSSGTSIKIYYIEIYKNGTLYSEMASTRQSGNSAPQMPTIYDLVQLNAGDTIAIACATNSSSETMDASLIHNYVSIARVGN